MSHRKNNASLNERSTAVTREGMSCVDEFIEGSQILTTSDAMSSGSGLFQHRSCPRRPERAEVVWIYDPAEL